MVKAKIFSNLEIFNIAQGLSKNFITKDIQLPVKINFYLQKNISIFIEMATELEKIRLEIFHKYGTLEGEQYIFKDEDIPIVNKEVEDLFNLEQEVKINIIPLSWFDNIELTSEQVKTISIMIEDEKE